MRILITGASGFLGYHLVKYLEKRKREITAVYRTRPVQYLAAVGESCDLAVPEQTQALLAKWQPTHIVHCAALTSTATCQREPEMALRDNFLATQNLVEAANKLFREKPFLLLVSTDLVFDGEKGDYSETDTPNPIMVYGRTKRAAEQAVELTYEGDWAIVRSALIYGTPTPFGKGSFLQWLLEDIQRGRCRLFADEFRSPIEVTELCWLIVAVLESGKTGYWHAGGAERLSRYEIGVLAAQAFGLPKNNIQVALLAEEKDLPAPRPKDVSMNITRARTHLGFNPRPLMHNLAELVQTYPWS